MLNWRHSSKYKHWHTSVLTRDKVCVICGSKEKLQVHHKNHASYFPLERFDIDNGETLCRNCHIQFHTNFKRSTRQKCTKYDWNNFLELSKYLKEC